MKTFPERYVENGVSFNYRLVEELDYRLGQIYGEGGVGGILLEGGTDEQPLVGDSGKSKWSNIGYLTDQEYLLLALELAFEYSADERWRIGVERYTIFDVSFRLTSPVASSILSSRLGFMCEPFEATSPCPIFFTLFTKYAVFLSLPSPTLIVLQFVSKRRMIA